MCISSSCHTRVKATHRKTNSLGFAVTPLANIPEALFERRTSVGTGNSHKFYLPVRGLQRCAAAVYLPAQKLKEHSTIS